MPTHLSLPNVKGLPILQVYQFLTNNTTIQATSDELAAKGWIPLITSGLVGISTSGYLVWTGATAGGRNTTEINSSDIKTWVQDAGYLKQSGLGLGANTASDPTVVSYKSHRLGYATGTTTAGGVFAADLELSAAVGSYKNRVSLRGIISTGAETPTFTFRDSVPTVCSGLGIVTHPAFVANVFSAALAGTFSVNLTANKNLGVNIANGGNAITYIFIYEYWYEA